MKFNIPSQLRQFSFMFPVGRSIYLDYENMDISSGMVDSPDFTLEDSIEMTNSDDVWKAMVF